MKKLFKIMLFAAIGIMTLSMAACSDKEESMEPNQLPDAAQVFIADYFGDGSIKSVKYDKDKHDHEYEVVLNNGFELTFDRAGYWTDIDAPAGVTIPEGIAPEPIHGYVNYNYPGYGINEIEKNRSTYDVELTNGVDLSFTLSGDYIGMNN